MTEHQLPKRLADETFRCWVVTGGRSEWHLIKAATLDDAQAAAFKKWKHKLVSVKAGPVPTKDAA